MWESLTPDAIKECISFIVFRLPFFIEDGFDFEERLVRMAKRVKGDCILFAPDKPPLATCISETSLKGLMNWISR